MVDNRDWQDGRWLLRAKTLPPQVPHKVFERPRLMELAARGRPRLLLVDAPAGYGKSTFLTQLFRKLSAEPGKVCWLTLDDDDQSADRFLSSLVITLARNGISLPRLEEAARTGFQDIHFKAGLTFLLAAVEELATPVTVILDDYHRVAGSGADQVIDLILAHQPEALTLVVAGRGRPGFRFEHLRAAGTAAVLARAELAFTEEEIATYMGGISPIEARMLAARTQGWPVAIQLASLWRDRNRDMSLLTLDSFSGRTRDLAAYLAEQVFLGLGEDIKAFLLAVSVVNDIDADLALSLSGRTDALALLEQLEEQGLPVAPLDERRSRFRFHQLFREFLRDRLERTSMAEARRLHGKAADWYAGQQHYLEAARHAAAAGDALKAAALLEQAGGWHQVLRGRLWSLLKFRDLPEQVFRVHPQLRLAQIYLMAREGEVREARAAFEGLRRLTGDFRELQGRDWDPRIDVGRLVVDLALRIYEAIPITLDDARRLERTIATLPQNDPTLDAMARHLSAIAHYDLGNFEACREVAEPLLAAWGRLDNPTMVNYMASYIARALFHLGAAQRAEQILLATHAQMDALFQEASRSGAVAPLFLSEIQYERGDLQGARRLMSPCFSRIVAVESWFDLDISAYRTASLLAFHLDGADEAFDTLRRGMEAARQRGLDRTERYLKILEIHVLWLAGRTEEALRLAAEPWFREMVAADVAREPWLWPTTNAALVIAARVTLAGGRPDEAATILASAIERFRAAGHKRHLLDALLVACGAAAGAGRMQDAASHLAEAWAIARTQGFTQPFRDEGADFTALLEDLARSGSRDAADLLARIGGECDAGDDGRGADLPPEVAGRLSPREQEVLALMGDGLSSKEIADRLQLSESTVKTHRKNLYRKLRVHRRSSAIALLNRMDG